MNWEPPLKREELLEAILEKSGTPFFTFYLMVVDG
jgi:hypothetical protein